MSVFRVSFTPVDQAAAVISARPLDWVDALPTETVEFDSAKFARGWMERHASRVLHGHFVMSEVDTSGPSDEELSREVFEF